MKGAVLIALNDMVEEVFSMAVWDQVLAKVKPDSEGIYISAESYDDAEVVGLVVALSELTGVPVNELVRSFGTYLFHQLNSKFPIFCDLHTNIFDLLSSIHGVIHKEVDKLYSNASLPTINCTKLSDSHLQMRYYSPRKLCVLAEGLIIGAAEHYKADVSVSQCQCVHQGADECLIDVKII
ncbi:heme NO-binding domain-containing protein [Saccharophagus degradans]|uniref:Heme NO binding n=1 Tax=Saccharophagus degradans (strain 2-40 / ATCC 43961 / DSM 17024) TaxID=203122 RepID=Q21E20_SACD2|nr:heme NO-binding domain-containing protein [Saccharophagus degradans]ABD83059.1 Heme NO binding [Saccharophagus degradans 2-40]